MNDRTPTEAKLLPCPFCGGTNVKTFGPYGWYRQWGISHSCRSFYNGAQELAQGFHSEADAVAAWNRRASPPAPAAEPVAWAVYWQGGLWALCETKREAVCEAGDLEPKGEARPLYTHPINAAAIRAEADESADRQWCEGAKTAVSMLDPLVIGVDMWPQSAQAKYRAALEKIDRLIATRRRAIIESRKERRALADKGEAE